MSRSSRDYTELSVPLGALFIGLGVGVWLLQAALGIFEGWTWAVLVGNVWVAVGSLLLFSDMRVYQFERSPVERLLVDGDESTR